MQNPVLDCIKNRYSCRGYSDTPLTDEQLEALTGAALAAPTGVNVQQIQVTAVTNKEIITGIDEDFMTALRASDNMELLARMTERGGSLFYNAPAVFFLGYGPGAVTPVIEAGIYSQTIALAAQSMGLGSVIIGMASGTISGTHWERDLFPEGYKYALCVAVGNPVAVKEPHVPNRERLTVIR